MAGAQPLDHLPDNVPIDLLNRPDFRLDIAVMPRLIWRLNMRVHKVVLFEHAEGVFPFGVIVGVDIACRPRHARHFQPC
jgi:hypothetical protein